MEADEVVAPKVNGVEAGAGVLVPLVVDELALPNMLG